MQKGNTVSTEEKGEGKKRREVDRAFFGVSKSVPSSPFVAL